MLSDLLPAYTINVANKSSPFVKKNLAVMVNPSKTFSRSSFVFLYYEIYGLSMRSGKTAYEVNYELTGAGKGKAASLSISSEQAGQDTRTVEFTNFNVSELSPGKYILKVLVRYLNSGTVAERSNTLYLTK